MEDSSKRTHSVPEAAVLSSAPDRRRRGSPFTTTGEQRIIRSVALAFAPVDKAALGVAIGVIAALVFAVVTLLDLAVDPAEHSGLELLNQYFYGYTISVSGAVIGAVWGFVVGFVAGWFLAFIRNLLMAIWLLYFRARADWRATSDFLDHV